MSMKYIILPFWRRLAIEVVCQPQVPSRSSDCALLDDHTGFAAQPLNVERFVVCSCSSHTEKGAAVLAMATGQSMPYGYVRYCIAAMAPPTGWLMPQDVREASTMKL